MSDIPQKGVTRTARLAALPLGIAGRATIGLGRRLGGKPADEVTAELQQRTAEQLFAVLGQLKGGAMKFGQALSVFEAAFPEDMAAPYREALTRLQDAAPPMDTSTVHRMMAEQFGRKWRDRFEEFSDTPAAAASIGQVHRGTWKDGRSVAIKVQYPGAGPALMGDFNQLARFAKLFARISPGLDVKALLIELRDRVAEELDYSMEADAQRKFAAAYEGDAQIFIPHVVASAPKALVTEWMDGTPLSRIIREGSAQQRDRSGELLSVLHFSAPARALMLHADPHPGNFRLLDDGRLGVVDFGAVARLPEGAPALIGRVTRLALNGDADGVLEMLHSENFIRANIVIDNPAALLDYLRPVLEPLETDTFTFTREWMRKQAARLADPRNEAARIGRQLNLPPAYALIHRVTLGSIGVLCQLNATARYRQIVERWQPGFAEDWTPADN